MGTFGLEVLIEELRRLMPAEKGGLAYGKFERSDWRPVWDTCTKIQESFKDTKFETREQQNALWETFSSLRMKASERAALEKDRFLAQSDRLSGEIIRRAENSHWEQMNDVIFFFDKTTVEEVKAMARTLTELGHELKENKFYMTGADKQACFQAIQDARVTHDDFFSRHKAGIVRRQMEFEGRRDDFRNRVVANIEKNKAALAKARDALYRVEREIEEIEEKIDEANDKWRSIFSEWLSEKYDKKASIAESIERIRGWINEDDDKLR